jgi:glycosyltransferase involved in cell wall biosynthesis
LINLCNEPGLGFELSWSYYVKFLLSIPARNEQNTITKVILDFIEYAKILGIELEVQVVDDNSTDNTAILANQSGAKVFSICNPELGGLANVFRREIIEFLSKDYDLLIHVDADGQYLAKDLTGLLEEVTLGADIVLGNRLWKHPPGMSEMRFDGNLFLSRLVSDICGEKIHDSQTGYRVFNRRVAEACIITSKFTYTQEQIIRASYNRMKISQVPIQFNAREKSAGKSRLMRNAFHYLSAVTGDMEDVIASLGINAADRI